MMCSRGYSNEFSGLCGSLLLGSGFLGSIITGIIVDKTGKMEEVAKVFYCMVTENEKNNNGLVDESLFTIGQVLQKT